MLKRFSLIVVLMAALNIQTVNAENVSHVLELYGYDTSIKVDKEYSVLDSMLEEYYGLAKEVNKAEMRYASKQVLDANLKEQLIGQQDKVYHLQEELVRIELEIMKASHADVEYLLELESVYLSIKEILIEEEENLNSLLESAASEYNYTELLGKKDSLEYISNDIEKQKDVIKRAESYPEIGDVKLKKYPLDRYSYITSDYGNRLDPISRSYIQFHTGIDLHAGVDTGVTAAYNGVVGKVGYDTNLGNFVIITHGYGLRTIYGHLKEYIVEVGQEVTQYEIIGYSGNSGARTTGPHLHFGVYINDKHVNPNTIIEGSQDEGAS